MLLPPAFRRLVWRVGRRLYCEARGEPSYNFPEHNGELYVARSVIAATEREPVLTILDVGANVGDWARPVLEAMPDARLAPGQLSLHLFEPVPQTRSRLVEGLAKIRGGHLARIETCALSDAGGLARMAVLSDTGGTNTLLLDAAVEQEAKAMVEVEKVTLADFAARNGLEQIHLVKIDTEGHDFSVLRGARPLLAAGKVDVVQFEYNHRWIGARAFLKDVFDLVNGLPYRVARVRPGMIEVFEAWHPELERFFEANYVLVKTSAMPWFKAHRGTFDGSNTYA